MVDNIYLKYGSVWEFSGVEYTGGSLMGGNFLGGSFPGGVFPRTEYLKFTLKFVNTYVLLMKFCCKTETLMLQINTNLTVSVVQLIINDKVTKRKENTTGNKKEAVCFFKCLHHMLHQLRHLETLYFLRSL